MCVCVWCREVFGLGGGTWVGACGTVPMSPPRDIARPAPYRPAAPPQIVYEFLLRYVVSSDTDAKVAKRHIDQNFVVHLLDLFDSGGWCGGGGGWEGGGGGGGAE